MKFTINKRYNLYVTLFTCAVGLWFMVNKFGLPVEKLIHYGVITLVLLLVLLAFAALTAYIIRLVVSRDD